MVASVLPGDEPAVSAQQEEVRVQKADVAAMQKAEDQERAENAAREAEEARRARDAREAETAEETGEKLAKLDSLLEKASMYSSFLFSNMATAASVADDTVAEVQQDEEEESEPVQGKRKRGRKKKNASAKKAKRGAEKLREMQEDASLDTRKQQDAPAFEQPRLMTGGMLRGYQLEGIRWLCNLFENGLNGILADEMGLGKTIQVIGLLAHLKALGVRGPHLIVAPLSTLMNWATEFRKWAPSMPVVIYHGNKQERRLIRKEKLNRKRKQEMNFPVIITSYEMMISDAKTFSNMGFVWKYMVIDEGHRLKNMNCLLMRELKRMRSENRLLLTGTPLQNNLTELWSLLNFILPDVFDDLELFESWFSFTPDASKQDNLSVSARDVLVGDKKVEVITKLHEILRPFLLRRLKVDVVEEMPSKTEIFVYCPMTPIQRDFQRMILDQTLAQAMEAKYGKYQAKNQFKTNSVKNRCMQLRKCCLHPYLFDEPTDSDGSLVTDENLVTSSGKMVVLDRMLRELKRKGHKVLIFSQMTNVMDILEDFLNMREYSYCRLDGGTHLNDRVEQMNKFNETRAGKDTLDNKDSIFCFLLSTRAGGLGVNLIAADTVIFFDSDWNPQQDNQAQDRCHRIGQTKEIVVYRLVTENSFENRMTQRAFEKRKLERVVIQRGEFKQKMMSNEDTSGVSKLTNAELEELLKDDVSIRSGVESGGISDDELAQILDRELVVKSFANRADRQKHAGSSDVLEFKGKGYEVAENAPTSAMESFA